MALIGAAHVVAYRPLPTFNGLLKFNRPGCRRSSSLATQRPCGNFMFYQPRIVRRSGGQGKRSPEALSQSVGVELRVVWAVCGRMSRNTVGRSRPKVLRGNSGGGGMRGAWTQRCSRRGAATRPSQQPFFHNLRAAQIRRGGTSAPGAASATASRKGPVVVIDNYDSFTYNLCQYLGDLSCEYVVLKNDEKTVEEIKAMNPRGVLVSPGPGTPKESGISLEAVKELGPLMPLFGVCMGHQCIGEAFGGDVIRAPTGLMHGKTSRVYHTNSGLLEGMENPFQACRYHSLVIKRETIPEDLEITAWTEDGNIMGVRHKKYPHIQGVQFHPESIITQDGKRIVGNWVKSLSA